MKIILMVIVAICFFATTALTDSKALETCDTAIQLLTWDGELFQFGHSDLELSEPGCRGFKLKCQVCASPGRVDGQLYADGMFRWMVVSFFCTNPRCRQYGNAPVMLDYPPLFKNVCY
jgi:hypothetical protein